MNLPRQIWRFAAVLCVGICLSTVSLLAFSKSLDVNEIGSQPIALTGYLSVMEDPSNELQLAQLQQPEFATRFHATSEASSTLNFGYTTSSYWLRLTLHNTSGNEANRLIELAYAQLSAIDFYAPNRANSYSLHRTGSALPFASRLYSNRNFVFPVAIPARAEQTYYFRVQATSALLIPAKIWTPQGFHEFEKEDYLRQAWYFGMASALVLFNLLLFLILRESVYLLYVGFISCLALSLGIQTGLAQEFMLSHATHWPAVSNFVGFSFVFALHTLFVRKMLDTSRQIPRLDVLLKLTIGALIATPIGIIVELATSCSACAMPAVHTSMVISAPEWDVLRP